MTRRTRRNHTPGFKAQVALAARKCDETLAELAQQYDIHPNQITDWKRQLTERAVQVFGDVSYPVSADPDLTKRHAKIGQLTPENDFFGTCAHQGGWASRKTILDAVRDAIHRHGCPEVFNTDQGCQFSSGEFTGLLKAHDIRIRMGGKGFWRDNVFVERLCKTVKYEEVYLKAYDSVADARAKLTAYIRFYNERRPLRALDGKTPDTAYFVALASTIRDAA